MMMMTGRLLLLCALCVLWCGAGGGGCSEADLALPGTGLTDNGNNSEGKNNTTDGVGGGGPIGQPAASQPAAPSSVPVSETKAESALKTGAKASETAEETIEKNKKRKTGEMGRRIRMRMKKMKGKMKGKMKRERKWNWVMARRKKKRRRKRKSKKKKMIPELQRGFQQAVRKSQFYLLVWRKHRIKQNPKALKQLATKIQQLMVQ
ncbi:mucin-associated surface protein (MASP) [Trypanosoma cruzi]|nr:mucin-associated surface protein (MASP) [Trypanosoma cruzi]